MLPRIIQGTQSNCIVFLNLRPFLAISRVSGAMIIHIQVVDSEDSSAARRKRFGKSLELAKAQKGDSPKQ